LTVRVWREGKTWVRVGAVVWEEEEVDEGGGWIRERRGDRCVHNAPTMVFTCALKFSGRDVGVGR
jgi:hypothetical protein